MSKTPTPHFLIIEDDPVYRRSLVERLKNKGKVFEAGNEKQAERLLTTETFNIVIIDLFLDRKKSGLKLLKVSKKRGFFSIILTRQDDLETIKKAYRLGCDHYLTKDQLGTCLDDIVKTQLADQTGQVIRDFFKEFVTDHQPLKEEIQSLASRYLRKPVILYGETGVGKGEVARLIHRLSGRNAGQFVDINVSTLSEALVESELFGHNEGAFTGASKSVRGKIHLAHEGTLFLDEIGMLTLTMQQKLLKVLEEKVYYRVGSDELQHSNFQLISATCDDIVKKMVDGGFRHDLYHRINGLPLTIPPLRHRREDIPLLIEHFIKREPRKIHLTAEAMDAMQRYNWYGNVRELQSLISQLVFAKKGTVTINDLPDHVVKNIHVGVSGKHRKFLPEEHYAYLEKHGFHRYIAALETEIFQYVMERFHGKVGKIAKYLKITGSSYYHLKRRRSENL